MWGTKLFLILSFIIFASPSEARAEDFQVNLCTQNCQKHFFDKLNNQAGGKADRSLLRGVNPKGDIGRMGGLGVAIDTTTCVCTYNAEPLTDSNGNKVSVIADRSNSDLQFSSTSLALVEKQPKKNFIGKILDQNKKNTLTSNPSEQVPAKANNQVVITACKANPKSADCVERRAALQSLNEEYADVLAKERSGATLKPEEQALLAEFKSAQGKLVAPAKNGKSGGEVIDAMVAEANKKEAKAVPKICDADPNSEACSKRKQNLEELDREYREAYSKSQAGKEPLTYHEQQILDNYKKYKEKLVNGRGERKDKAAPSDEGSNARNKSGEEKRNTEHADAAPTAAPGAPAAPDAPSTPGAAAVPNVPGGSDDPNTPPTLSADEGKKPNGDGGNTPPSQEEIIEQYAKDQNLIKIEDAGAFGQDVWCKKNPGTSVDPKTQQANIAEAGCKYDRDLQDEMDAHRAQAAAAADAEAQAKSHAANQPAKSLKYEGSKDACASTINALVVKKAIELKGGNPSRDELVIFMNEDKTFASERTKIEDKHGCSSDINWLDNMQMGNQGLKMATTTAAGVMGGLATYEVQKAANDPNQNLNRVANDQMADTMVRTGIMQTITGAAQGLAGTKALFINKSQKNSLSAINNYNGDDGEVVKSGNNQSAKTDLTAAGATVASLKKGAEAGDEAAADYNAEGQSYVQQSRETHTEIKQRSAAEGAGYIIESAMSLAQGITSIVIGTQMKCDSDNTSAACMGAMPSPPPPLVGGVPEQVEASGGVPMPVPGVGGAGDASPVVAEAIESLDEKPLDGDFPLPPGGGGGGGNNLVHRPDTHKGNLVAGTGSGSGGGVGGGGGGGGGNAQRGNEKGSGEKTISASGKKFGDSIASGGAGFASSGGGARRSEGTNMEMGGLFDKLGAMLPNNRKDQKADSNILDFGTRGPAAAGSGDTADGSILGRDSNLFLRISNTTMTYYKKGRLK